MSSSNCCSLTWIQISQEAGQVVWYSHLLNTQEYTRWQEYTEELYKRDLHDPDNHDGMITHLEPEILECEVKWALGSITMNKASGGDGIPFELLQIIKDDAMKVLHSICQQIWKTQQQSQDWKRPVFIPIPKKGNAKECSNYCTIARISHASKIMLKFSKPGFNRMRTVNFLMFKLDLEKAEEPEIKLPTSVGSWKKQEEFQKNIYFCFIDYANAFVLCGSQQTVENSSRDSSQTMTCSTLT